MATAKNLCKMSLLLFFCSFFLFLFLFFFFFAIAVVLSKMKQVSRGSSPPLGRASRAARIQDRILGQDMPHRIPADFFRFTFFLAAKCQRNANKTFHCWSFVFVFFCFCRFFFICLLAFLHPWFLAA